MRYGAPITNSVTMQPCDNAGPPTAAWEPGRVDARYVLFDFDGTLVDSGAVIVEAIRAGLDHAGVAHDHLDETALRSHIGVPLPHLYPILDVPETGVDRAIAHFQSYFRQHGARATVPFPGVADLLFRLRACGVTLAVATAKPQRTAADVIAHLGWAELFAAVAGANDDETGGAKHEVVGRALDQLAALAGGPLRPDAVVMVGDRAGDVAGARDHGIEAIAVTWGFGSREELEGAAPAAIVDTIDELAELLDRHLGATHDR